MYSDFFLARIEVEILLRKKLFFADFAERPEGAPARSNKKSFFFERLKRKAGLATNYQFLPEPIPIPTIIYLILLFSCCKP